MKTLVHTTIRSLLIYALPLFIVTSALLGFNLGYSEGEEFSENNAQIEFALEDEEYIDDIPFDTEKIANLVLFDESQKEIFQFDDEAYIDDIPFDTKKIVLELNETYVSVK